MSEYPLESQPSRKRRRFMNTPLGSKKIRKQKARAGSKRKQVELLTGLEDQLKDLRNELQQKKIKLSALDEPPKSVRRSRRMDPIAVKSKLTVEIQEKQAEIEKLEKTLNKEKGKINEAAAREAGIPLNSVIAPKSSIKEFDNSASTAEWCLGEIDQNGQLIIDTNYSIVVEGFFGNITTSYDPINRVITKNFSASDYFIEMHHNEMTSGEQILKNVYINNNALIFSQQTNGITVEQGSAIIMKLKGDPRYNDIFKIIIDNKYSLDANHSRQNKFFKNNSPNGNNKILAHVHHPDFEKKMIFDSFQLQNVNNTGYNAFMKSLEGTNRGTSDTKSHLEQVLFSVANGVIQITHDRTNALNCYLLEEYLSEHGLLFQEHGSDRNIIQIGNGIEKTERKQKFIDFLKQEQEQKPRKLISNILENVNDDENFKKKIILCDIFHDQTDRQRTVAGYIKTFVSTIKELTVNDDIKEFIDILKTGGTSVIEDLSKEFILNPNVGKVIGSRDETTLINFMQEVARDHLLAVDVLTTRETKLNSGATTRDILKTLMANSSTAKRADLGRLAIFKIA